MKWVKELPAPTRGRNSLFRRITKRLAMRPGVWAALRTYTRSNAWSVASRMQKKFAGFEFAARSAGNGKKKSVLYGRKK